MKSFKVWFLFLVIMMAFMAGCTKIDQGYEGAKINTLGSDKGEIEILGTGWHFFNALKYDVKENPTFVKDYIWTAALEEGSPTNESITFQSSNSLAFTADVGVSLSLIPGKSGELYRKYHKTVEEIIKTNVRNTVRDAFNRIASGRDEENIYGGGKADFVKAVEADVREFWGAYLDIKKIYLVGKLDPPEEVKKAISKKIEATQMAEMRRNEVEQSKAEADKEIETARGLATSKRLGADAKAYSILAEAEAEAKKIKLINDQLSKSPDYNNYLLVTRWSGDLPLVTGGTTPLINFDKLQRKE